MKIQTDRKLLQEIHDRYYETFASYQKGDDSRDSKIYVPIDVDKVASAFDVDGDIIFGRLYYHLDRKYGYKQDDGRMVHFFARVAGNDRHCVNFPLLTAVLADLKLENRKFRIATGIAFLSLIISIIAIYFSTSG